MLLEITVGVAAVFAAEPVDVLSGGIHADVGLRRGILAVIRVGELFCLEQDLRIRGMGSDMLCIVLTLAADGAGIVITPGRLAGLGALGKGCSTCSAENDDFLPCTYRCNCLVSLFLQK